MVYELNEKSEGDSSISVYVLTEIDIRLGSGSK
jgi:hypothetical protein